jgi:hypothetical protein
MNLAAKINRIFAMNVETTPEGCQLFTGACNNGYGTIYDNKIPMPLHKVIWEQVHEKLPKGKRLINSCGHRNCINIRHWSLAKTKKYEKRVDTIVITRKECCRPGLWWMVEEFDKRNLTSLELPVLQWQEMKKSHASEVF